MSMIVNDTGSGILQIRHNGLGSYIWMNSPLSLTWLDQNGSVGKYLCIFPLSKEYREVMLDQIRENLYRNYSEAETQLANDFDWLFKILERGNYYITYESKMNYKLAYNSSLYNSSMTLFKSQKQKQHLIDKITQSNVTDGYYDGLETHLIFTEPLESINQDRVDFFKCEIKDGKRPAAIVLSTLTFTDHKDKDGHHSQVEYETATYILDGHHKLIAYSELNICPVVIKISKMEVISQYHSKFNLSDLEDNLFSFQIKHIKTHMSS